MNFEEALCSMRWGAIMRRKNWKASVGMVSGKIVMGWPSGVIEYWRPTLADIEAIDWERVK